MSSNLNLQNFNHMQPQMYNPAFAQTTSLIPNMQGGVPAMQGLDYDTLKLQAEEKAKDNALAQVTRHYDSASPETSLATMAQSFLCSLLMSIGFTSATNWLMSSKKIADGATNLENFEKTRLYKIGQALDNKIGDTKVVKGIASASNGIKSFFSKLTPNVVKEAFAKMKMGSIAVWDKQGMFSLGKGAESLNDFTEAATKVSNDKLKTLLATNGVAADKIDEVIDIVNKVKKGSIRGTVAFDKLMPIFEKMPAKELAKLNAQGFFGKMFGLRTDLNMGIDKARFFNGALNKSQGPIAKLFQKMTALVGEASGNGVLGGKFALFAGTFGLMQGFTAAFNAEKGDKLKAFMEDYIGFTLGSYLMSFVVGTWFNKFLGVTEIGMDTSSKAFKDICGRLGLDKGTQRVQEAVIAFNREFKDVRSAKNIIEKLNKNKMTQEQAYKALKNLIDNKNLKVSMYDGITTERLVKRVTDRIAEFETNGSLRTAIKDAMKSKLTVKNAGLGRYIVQKPLEVIGKIFSVGRYSMMDGSKFSAKSIGKFAKRFGGGVGRMILVGFVLVEPFRKGFMKLSHAIFGKPKNSALDEGKTEAENLANIPQGQAQETVAQQPQNTQVNQQLLQQQLGARPTASTPLNNSQPIASTPINNTTANNSVDDAIAATELKRTYIPSAQPSQFALQKDPRKLEVEQAIAKAEGAEKLAQNFLSNGI